MKMKGCIAPALILFSLIFITGMGELGGGPVPSGKIPIPEKNFSVEVLDREGVKTTLQSFSYEGKIFLAGKHGSALITVPFEKLTEIQVQGQEGSEIVMKVILKDQKNLSVKIDKQGRFFGKTDFGTYQVETKDLKSIRFLF